MFFEYQATKTQVENLLNIKPGQLQDHDNLIEWGINSLKIMRLVNEWRKRGAAVTFTQLISQPTFSAWWQLLSLKQQEAVSSVFTILPLPNHITNSLFELTPIQYAYWVGRKSGQVLGDIGCHAYLEIDSSLIDPKRLAEAWRTLLQIHPALRTRFTIDGKQEVLSHASDPNMTIYAFQHYSSPQVEAELLAIRRHLSHRKLRIEDGENAGLALSLLPAGKNRIHFDVDLLAADVQSFQILLRDLAVLYRQEAVAAPLHWNFAAYLDVVKKQHKKSYEQAEQYWQKKVLQMPLGPRLPLLKLPQEIKKPLFQSCTATFSPSQWNAIKQKAASYQVTPAMFFLAIYCEILDRWSESSHFLINLPIFNRQTEFDGIEDVVADFSNILLLEADCHEPQTFIERIRQLQERFHQDIAHSAYSGIQVTRELSQLYPEEPCIAPVVFACNLGEPLLDQNFQKTFGELAFMSSQTPQVWIDFQMFDYQEGIYIRWDAVAELFSEGMLEQMFQACCQAIAYLAKPDSDWEAALSLAVVQSDLLRLKEDIDFSSCCDDETLISGFFDYSRKNPNHIAIRQSDTKESFTYGELAANGLQTASYLQSQGVVSGDVVAVSLPRGIWQIVAVLGILAAGACYVPIGVTQPAARQKSMYRQSGARFVLTNRPARVLLDLDDDIKIILLEDRLQQPALSYPVPILPAAPAYIIFTSGSTGTPKGVKISHEGALNTIKAVNQKCQIEDCDTGLAVSSLEFDLSVYDIFGLLSVGASLICISEQTRRSADDWVRIIQRYQVTVWNSVPILFDMLLVASQSQPQSLNSLRWVFLSGDWISLSLPEQMYKQIESVRMLAMGGATEASIWSNYYEVTLPLDPHWCSIPYGYPLAQQKYCIMDQKKRPCPVWVPGELWIGGKGLAIDYQNDEALTNQKFIWHNNERWYRTGDLGRYWQDGTIEFLGRQDSQVKIRGHRIELGEIASTLRQITNIKDVIVLATDMLSGQKELIAFLVCQDPDASHIDPRPCLVKQLPDYMIPKHYYYIENLPLNNRGKVDRKQLERYANDHCKTDSWQLKHAVTTELEQKLARIWQQTLKQQEIFLEDSYFALGGNSLTAVQLAAAIQTEFQVKLMLEHIFQKAVFGEQAAFVEALIAETVQEAPPSSPKKVLQMDQVSRFQPFPLTDLQAAYWIGRQGIYDLGEISTHYYFEIENSGFDKDKFKQAFQAFLASHDMMRAVISADGENQMVLKEVPPYEIVEYHLEELATVVLEQKLQSIREELAHRLFKPDEWPLFDIRMALLPNQKIRLHLCFDNIIFDGWSIFYFFREINRMYHQDCYQIQEPVITFRDYVMEMNRLKQTAAFQIDREYWMNRLNTLPPAPELPTQAASSHCFQHLEYHLPALKWQQLKKQLMSLGKVTPAVFLMTAYAEILATWSRRQTFTLNLTRFNRRALHPNIDEVVGDFTSLTLLEINLQPPASFWEQCQAIQTQLLKDLEHTLFCGVQLQRELGKQKRNQQQVLMPVVFTSSLGLNTGETAGANWFENRVYSSSETPQVWLDHQVTEEQEGLVLIWDYVKEIFPTNMIPEMFAAYIDLINRLADDVTTWNQPDTCLISIPQIKQFELANQIQAPLTNETLVSLFRKQCKKTPQNIALIHENKQLTYQELNQQIDYFAQTIKRAKLGASKLIGIFMEKGFEQTIAALAIMAAGYAYLPLDIHHPDHRNENLLHHAQVSLVLTQPWLKGHSISGIQWLDVDTTVKDGALKNNTENLVPAFISPQDLAYVIYTSGSTGMPKGVSITHESVVNTILDINQRFAVNQEDRCIALSNLNFDLSVFDQFGLLAAGGAIVIPDRKRLKDPAHWLDLLKRHQVSIWNTVPTFMHMMTESLNTQDFDDHLRLVMLSGDWIPLALPKQIKQHFPSSLVVSLGGATEASVWSNYYIINHVNEHWRSIPYGKPLCNQTLLIYNDRLQPCPCGIVGHLYIGGVGVATGYWQDEAQTAKQFIIHPVTLERIYQTGDLARYMTDGNIEFLGREDSQVKIRGHRIELGEIEHALLQFPFVKDAVVIADYKEKQQLLAIVIPELIQNDYLHTHLQGLKNSQIQDLQAVLGLQETQEKMTDMVREMHTISLCGAVDLLRNIGFITSSANDLLLPQHFQLPQKMAELGLDQRFLPLFRHWLKYLEQVGAIYQQTDLSSDYQLHPTLDEWSLNLRKEQPYSAVAHELTAFYQEIKEVYSAVLKGQQEVSTLLLDSGFTNKIKQLSGYQWINQYFYEALAQILNKYVQTKTVLETEKVAVLELGSRFGGWLEHIYASSLWQQLDYTYTDGSAYFLTAIKDQYPDLPCEVLDLSKPLERSGFDLKQFDVIIADQALHRVAHIEIALEQIKQLLSPQGVLIFIENTSLNCFDLNIAGLYEYGFSQYQDERKERQTPFLNQYQWLTQLEKNGLEMIDIFPSTNQQNDIYGRYLYLVRAKQQLAPIETAKLASFLTSKIPEYMIPQHYFIRSQLPLTTNGKIDRKQLSEDIPLHQSHDKKLLLPQNEVEQFILELWQRILQLDRISTDDNFFELGGDSLLAVQCMNQLNKHYALTISLQEIFTANTIRNLADHILSQCHLGTDMVEGEI